MPHKTPNTQAPAALPEAGFVRLSTILKIYPVGRSTWWAGVKSGRYPAGVKIGPNTTAWHVADIRALLAQHTGEA
jgi:prophage regulatory protein